MGTLPSPSGDVTPWKLIDAIAEHYNSITDKNLSAAENARTKTTPTATSPVNSSDTVVAPTKADVTKPSESVTVVNNDPSASIPSMGWKSEITAAPEKYRPLIEGAAARSGLPTFVVASLLNQESGFNPNARSPVGAAGLGQFMPGTAREEGVDVRDPSSSIYGAANYLSKAVDKYNGNFGLGLAAYNWGSGNVDRWVKSGYDMSRVPAETRNYVKSITGKGIDEWAKHGNTIEPVNTQKGTPVSSIVNDQEGKQQFAANPDNRYSWLEV